MDVSHQTEQSGTSSAMKIRSIQLGQEQIEPQRLDSGRLLQVETRQSSTIPLPPRQDLHIFDEHNSTFSSWVSHWHAQDIGIL